MYLYCFCMLVQGTAEKQLLLMLSPCLNNIKKKKKKKARRIATAYNCYDDCRGGSRSWQGEGHKQAKLVGGWGEPYSLVMLVVAF